MVYLPVGVHGVRIRAFLLLFLLLFSPHLSDAYCPLLHSESAIAVARPPMNSTSEFDI